MNDPILVRAACADDVPAMVDVGSRAARQAYTGIVTADYLDRVVTHFYGADRIGREVAPVDDWFGYRVAICGADVVGLAGSGRVPDAPGTCELYALYVDPRHQRRGVGQALVLDAVAQAREHGAVTLRVAVMPGNARAVAFYETLAFTFAGERPIYAPHGEHGGPAVALVYERHLEASRASPDPQ